MNKKRIILGLDVSTATIGICLMLCEDDNIEIIKLTHITPKISSKIKGVESLFLKKAIFETEFLQQYKDYGITDVIIEEPLLGSNNVNTVGILLKFNALISESIYKILGIVPKYMSSYESRAYAFPELFEVRKLNKKDEIYPLKDINKNLKSNNVVLFGGFKWDVAKKNILLDKISDRFTNIEWIYDKDGELKKENFDASDSAVCCIGYINKLTYGDIQPVVTDIVHSNNHIEYNVRIWDKIFKHKICF